MIKLTRMSGTVILMNEDFIALAEETPDTVVTMHNGRQYFVRETIDEIYAKVIEHEKEKKA